LKLSDHIQLMMCLANQQVSDMVRTDLSYLSCALIRPRLQKLLQMLQTHNFHG
jgi:hypothetical protein